MGLNRAADNDTSSDPADGVDDLAAYALDAVDTDEAHAIETLLAGDPAAATIESVLRDAAGEYADAAIPPVDTTPPVDLRDRILGLAHRRRTPTPVEAASAVEVHRIETERLELLLRRLTPEQWQMGVDPPEFAGWTIHDLVAHLASNQALLAQVLGRPVPGVPETLNLNEERTAEVIARHRGLSTDQTLAEYGAARLAVDEVVSAMSDDDLELDVEWWGMRLRVLTALVVRSFETWTHADDIRRSLGLAQLPPPAPALKTMSQASSGWAPVMLLAGGLSHPDRSVRYHLTGPGGGVVDVDLGFGGRDLSDVTPDAEMTVDIIDFCRTVGGRGDHRTLDYAVTGDVDLAHDLVSCLHLVASL